MKRSALAIFLGAASLAACAAPVRAGDDGAAVPTATARADDAEPAALAALRLAHAIRDEAAIARAESALVAGGAEVLPAVKAAFERERQFNMKVSLGFVICSIEGDISARAIVERMRAARAPDEKMRLAFMLGKVDAAKELDYLLGQIAREEDPMIKRFMVRSASRAEGAEALRALIRVAASDPDRQVRIEMIRDLEARGGPDVAEAFLGLAREEEDPSVRSLTVRSLASIATGTARPFFLEVLEKGERTNDRAEAARYFARAGASGDIPALRALAEREKVYYIRQKIAQALEAIERRAAPPAPVLIAPGETKREPTLF